MDNPITVEHNPSPMKLEVLYVDNWPVWSKEASTFDWHYDTRELCYILEGEAVVTPKGGGAPVTIKARDLVNFAKGLSCTWQIVKPIRKHYLIQD